MKRDSLAVGLSSGLLVVASSCKRSPSSQVHSVKAEFAWSKPERFGRDENQDGRIDVPNTRTYASGFSSFSRSGYSRGLLICSLWLLVLLCFTLLAAQAASLKDGEITDRLGGPSPEWGSIFYVNGINTSADAAIKDAENIARKSGFGVRLIYNDLEMSGLNWLHQGPALLTEKFGDADVSVNKATDCLVQQTVQQCESGKQVWLIGHSAGTLCIQNTLIKLASRWKKLGSDRKKDLLSRISVLYLGGAVFKDDHQLADVTPEGVARFEIHDVSDWVAQFAGAGDWGKSKYERHALEGNYLQHISCERFRQRGELLVNGDEVVAEVVLPGGGIGTAAVRVKLLDLSKTQESRRSMNFRIPWRGKSVVCVENSGKPAKLRFAILETNPLLPDEALIDGVVDGQEIGLLGSGPFYIGRVTDPSRPEGRPHFNSNIWIRFQPSAEAIPCCVGSRKSLCGSAELEDTLCGHGYSDPVDEQGRQWTWVTPFRGKR